jgi:hypothetical protein
MSETEKIGYEKDGRTAVITLQRPETRNAIDPEMDRRLQEIWSDFRDDDDLDLQWAIGPCSPALPGAELEAKPEVKYDQDRLQNQRRTAVLSTPQ